MQVNEVLSITVVLTAIFAYANHRWIKWPPIIGIMVLSLLCSLLLVVVGGRNSILSQKAIQVVASIDFKDVLMNYMLSFLLFAGAIHMDAGKLKKERLPIIVLATAGILISTFLVGSATWYLFGLFHIAIPFTYCLLFGALISPTDPIAVLGILKKAKIPSSLELKISGESLFNDGVAVVLFICLAEVASAGNISAAAVGKLFLQQALGGLLFGAMLGYLGARAMASIDDYIVEVLITLAIVLGGYFIASHFHVSGPLAMVVAGIIIGDKAKEKTTSNLTRDYLGKFWELMDEILNAILFLLIGLEMLVVKLEATLLIIGAISILVVLLARWFSVLIPVYLLKFTMDFERNAITILTWGGLRGCISVALALSLRENMFRDEFVSITYIIVVFSILVQGLTIGPLAKKLQQIPT